MVSHDALKYVHRGIFAAESLYVRIGQSDLLDEQLSIVYFWVPPPVSYPYVTDVMELHVMVTKEQSGVTVREGEKV